MATSCEALTPDNMCECQLEHAKTRSCRLASSDRPRSPPELASTLWECQGVSGAPQLNYMMRDSSNRR
eukprot:11686568-Alexandrium_andersonii.AAC.1